MSVKFHHDKDPNIHNRWHQQRFRYQEGDNAAWTRRCCRTGQHHWGRSSPRRTWDQVRFVQAWAKKHRCFPKHQHHLYIKSVLKVLGQIPKPAAPTLQEDLFQDLWDRLYLPSLCSYLTKLQLQCIPIVRSIVLSNENWPYNISFVLTESSFRSNKIWPYSLRT